MIRYNLLVVLLIVTQTFALKAEFTISKVNGNYFPQLALNGSKIIGVPSDGLWSIATSWENKWPTSWHHASPIGMESSGNWQIVKGVIELPQGKFLIRD